MRSHLWCRSLQTIRQIDGLEWCGENCLYGRKALNLFEELRQQDLPGKAESQIFFAVDTAARLEFGFHHVICYQFSITVASVVKPAAGTVICGELGYMACSGAYVQ